MIETLFPSNDFTLIGVILGMPLLGAFVNGIWGPRLGKDAVLYIYPFESHAPRAKENLLDLWARWLGWFDFYVKNTPAAKSPAASSPTAAQP